MTRSGSPLLRRRTLLSALAAAAVVPLTGCPAPRGGGTTPLSPSPSTSPLPFGLKAPSSVEACIFDGAFGTQYVREAAAHVERLHDGVRVRVTAIKDVTVDLSARFAEGATPPDLLDNSGTGRLAVGGMVDEFTALDDLIAAANLEGTPIGETLYAGVLDSGRFNGRLVAVNYALTVFGLWYSSTLFAERGWALPTTWDALLELGQEARAEGRYLFAWGERAANYFQELAITSAVKEGGHAVRRALDNLEEGCWTHSAVLGVLEQLEACVDAGLVLAGGPYLEAQARWSSDRKALCYPSGAWIVKETEATTAPGFGMTVAPVPTLTAAPSLPDAAVHATPMEQFLVPRRAANPAGGLELLRVMLSREATRQFTRVNRIPTIVQGSIPDDLDSAPLRAQTRLLADAGDAVFSWRFTSYYGRGDDYERLWARFLKGGLSASALAEQLQAITDAIRTDPTVQRYTAD